MQKNMEIVFRSRKKIKEQWGFEIVIAKLKAPFLNSLRTTPGSGTPPSGKIHMDTPFSSLLIDLLYTSFLLSGLSRSTSIHTLL